MVKRSHISYLDGSDIINIHNELVKMFEGHDDPISPSGPRDENLVHSASARPRTSLGEIEKYRTIQQKAAALFHSLVRSHPFRNGNKRTALSSLAIFLDRNHSRLSASDDDLFDFVLSVANRVKPFDGEDDAVVEGISRWVRAHLVHERHDIGPMSMNDFLTRCESAGAKYREGDKGVSWLVVGPNAKSIRLSKSTKRLDGNVVRRYIRNLGLSEAFIGIHLDEFQNGLSDEQKIMRRFRNVLRRLAYE